MELKNIDTYFSTARERYAIKLRKDSGQPGPWTKDQIFQDWRFCNVHREHDKTTIWFREQVRSKLKDLAVVEATMIFRWFNKIETGEIIKDLLLNGWDTEEARRRLQYVHPLITGAFMIKSPTGLNKLDGLLECIDLGRPILAEYYPTWGRTLKDAWVDVQRIGFLGGFLAYEIVSDLRWTNVLDHAIDITTWTNAGPGCTRGIGLVVDGRKDLYDRYSSEDQLTMLVIMQEILKMSKDDRYWPTDWPAWEMREVEHWACEYAKYYNASAGIRLKRRFECT